MASEAFRIIEEFDAEKSDTSLKPEAAAPDPFGPAPGVSGGCASTKLGAVMQLHFSTDNVPLRDREQFCRDVFATQVMRVTSSDRPDFGRFRAHLDAQVVGRFTLIDFQTPHRTGRRTAADARKDNSDRFRLCRVPCEQSYTAAPTRLRSEEIRLAPGDFCVSSCEWPCEWEMQDGASGSSGWPSQDLPAAGPACRDDGAAPDQTRHVDGEGGHRGPRQQLSTRPEDGQRDPVHHSSLLIPRAVLSPLVAGGRLTGPVVIPARSPLGTLVEAAFGAVNAQAPFLSPALGDAVLQNVSRLVALACGASEEGRWSGSDALRLARLEAAKRHIEQHLAEPDLTPAHTAAALGISVRTLHLAFEPTGTSFAEHVTRRRLQECRAALERPTATRSITDVAFAWGFSNLTTFYRAFRREFGMAPGQLRPFDAAKLRKAMLPTEMADRPGRAIHSTPPAGGTRRNDQRIGQAVARAA